MYNWILGGLGSSVLLYQLRCGRRFQRQDGSGKAVSVQDDGSGAGFRDDDGRVRQRRVSGVLGVQAAFAVRAMLRYRGRVSEPFARQREVPAIVAMVYALRDVRAAQLGLAE
jgi:hypothetical protein